MEVEVKGKISKEINPEDFNWEFCDEVWEEDLYFEHPCRRFGETDEALRVRFSEKGVELTYKGPKVDEVTKSREEISVKTSENIVSVLEKLGFETVGKIKKKRKIYRKGDLSLFLDEVWGEAFGEEIYLGKYLEVEGIGEYEELVDRVISEAKKLGVKEFERRSYLELLLSRVKPSLF